MIAYIFPGQGAQYPGMAKELYENSEQARQIMEQANDILGFRLTDIMFEGSEEELKQTRVTQPAIFLHSVASFKTRSSDMPKPSAVAGHSLGEFSALVAAGVLDLESGIQLVSQRAEAMQKACELQDSTMAAIVGMEDEVVENICEAADGIVVAANYNCPGQLVISGEKEAVLAAVAECEKQGARRAIVLNVGGAFHSPLMEPAREQLQAAILETNFSKPVCPVYQNVMPQAITDPELIQKNLVAQLTAPVKWTQIMKQLIEDGVTQMIEVGGNGKVLTGLVKKLDRRFPIESIF